MGIVACLYVRWPGTPAPLSADLTAHLDTALSPELERTFPQHFPNAPAEGERALEPLTVAACEFLDEELEDEVHHGLAAAPTRGCAWLAVSTYGQWVELADFVPGGPLSDCPAAATSLPALHPDVSALLVSVPTPEERRTLAVLACEIVAIGDRIAAALPAAELWYAPDCRCPGDGSFIAFDAAYRAALRRAAAPVAASAKAHGATE